MGAHRLGQTGRIERGRGNGIAPLDRRPARALAGGLNHRDGSELGEAVFPRIAAVRFHPGDVVRDDATARLDAAMVLVEVDVTSRTMARQAPSPRRSPPPWSPMRAISTTS